MKLLSNISLVLPYLVTWSSIWSVVAIFSCVVKKLDITIVFEEPFESSAEGGGPFIPIVQHIELLTLGSRLFSETRWTSDA